MAYFTAAYNVNVYIIYIYTHVCVRRMASKSWWIKSDRIFMTFLYSNSFVLFVSSRSHFWLIHFSPTLAFTNHMMTSSNGNIFRVTDPWGIHRRPVNSPHKCQWRGALVFLLTCAWINGCANNRQAGHLRRHRVHYDVIVMICRPC